MMGISQKCLSVIYYFFLILFFIPQLSCNTTEPPDPKPDPALNLELEDVSCTEAWITLTTNNLQLPATLNLLKDNNITKTINLQTADTLLYIDSLLPNQTYNFKLSGIGNPASGINSNELSVTTMDTTSHNFTFQSWTFGGTAGSSVLYDVAIIDENNIIAVGEIMVADSSPNGYTTYNAVHWDGNQWELKRIRYYGSCSAVEYPALRAIWAFSENNIVVTNGGSIGWYDGNTIILDCGANPLLKGAVRKIWGSSSTDLYIVGNSGSIAHYNGTSWKKIASGTDIDINDVWGIIDPITNSRKVFCAVSFVLQLGEHKILTLDENNKVDSIPWNTGRRVGSVWTSDGEKIYTGGGGIFQNKSGNWNEETSIPLYYTNRVRGNGLNDVFVGGDFGLLAHFNGVEWKVYQEFLQLPSTSFNSITVKGNIIATVGFNGEKAMITIGRRN